MLRQFHSVVGLVAGLFLIVVGLSGAVLSLDPVMERMDAVNAANTIAVADFAARVQAAYPGVERIDRRPNGAVVIGYATAEEFGSVLLNPLTLEELAQDEPSAVMIWMKNLHRSFLLDDAGRMVAGGLAGTLGLLAATGLFLFAFSQGGWRRLLRPVRANGVGGWHAMLGRLAVMVLLVSALTGAYMSLSNFGFIDDGSADSPDFPFEVSGGVPMPVAEMTMLQDLKLGDLTRLVFPQPNDLQDVFGLQTRVGSGFIDQSTGEVLNWMPLGFAQKVWDFIYMLHTGQGLWWFGLLLGAGGVLLPVLAVTGTLVWLRRHRARPRIAQNVRAALADTVILVGSEGGTTWGFAQTLHRALTEAGHKVHTAPMNALGRFAEAKQMFVLAATYGDGVAPASANRFLDRLAALPEPGCRVAVLGFGDRMFPDYCGYADKVAEAMTAKGWFMLCPLTRIDRQSVVDFAAWGRDLGAVLGIDLVLDHRPKLPALQDLRLISRVDYGQEVQAPTAVLRFGPATAPAGWRRLFGNGLPRFQAGDLVGIVPPGSELPRYYSLSSANRDGVLEICVRKSAGGLCSGHLHGLGQGDSIRAFIRPNPAFRPLRNKAPVVLVAAGCGIGPMAGFLRHNRPGRQMELYFGLRDPASDFLYQQELDRWQSDGRLSRLVTAVSRGVGRLYVQDRLRQDGQHLRDTISRGGQVMVCGGIAMARSVAAEFDHALRPIGQSVARLKAEGRYLEDVY